MIESDTADKNTLHVYIVHVCIDVMYIACVWACMSANIDNLYHC